MMKGSTGVADRGEVAVAIVDFDEALLEASHVPAR